MSPRLEIEHDEAQDEQRGRGQGIRAALLALAVAGLVGGSWWAGHRSPPAAPDVSAVPEIHADKAPVKEPPKDPGGLVVPGQDSVLLNREAKAKPEELLPPAEAVKPRPIPPAPPPQAETANPSAPTAPSTPPANISPAWPSPAPQVATVPPAPGAAPMQGEPKAAAPIGGPVPKVAPLATPGAGSYRLQLGALKTEEAAKAEWLKLQRQNSDVLGKLSLSVSRVDLGAKGTYYRIQAGPIADEAKAAQGCAALKSRKIACILVKS
jgi:cell division septation protein DedD